MLLFRRGWRNRASLQGCIIWSSTNSSLCMLTKQAYLAIQLQVNLRLLCRTVVLMFKCCCGKTAQENLEFILAHVKFDKLCFPESHNPLTCSFFFHNSTSVYKTTTWFWKKNSQMGHAKHNCSNLPQCQMVCNKVLKTRKYCQTFKGKLSK